MINTTQDIFIYDDRNKVHEMGKVYKILYEDDIVCLCQVKFEGDDDIVTILGDDIILFNKNSREVLTTNFMFWFATNDRRNK